LIQARLQSADQRIAAEPALWRAWHRFLDAFLAAAADADLARVLPAVAEWRKSDSNIQPDERAAIDRLLARGTLDR